MSTTTETSEWINKLCWQFTAATGWPLHFFPVDQTENETSRNSCCWQTEVRDEIATRGFLRIDQPHNRELDESFLSACNVADALAQLASQTCATHQSLSRRENEINALIHLGDKLPTQPNELEIIDLFLSTAIEITGFYAAIYFAWSDSSKTYIPKQTILNELEQIKQPIASFDAPSQNNLYVIQKDVTTIPSWFPENASVGIGVPVTLSPEQPPSFLWVFDRRKKPRNNSLNREQNGLLSLANQLSNSLERSNEKVEFQKAAEMCERLKNEFQVATGSQPRETIHFIDSQKTFEAAGYCISQHEVGGDLCELIPISDRHTLLAMGDATGNSIPAALIMSFVRGSIHLQAQSSSSETLSPKRVMKKLNDALQGITHAFQFMSLIYAVLDSETGTVCYGNAGHPPPILFNQEKQKYQPLDSHGILLGLMPDMKYGESTITLTPGEQLVFFTDGITEARNADKEMFHTQGIIDSIRSTKNHSPEELINTIQANVALHLNSKNNSDDQSLLVVKRNVL